ncbi:MAG: helix-turn-helix domain-containing protein [Planctomycetes bacterium]|nr:helix-turn-helix domain-containing protein [Planctomycetota bacterium]
MTDARDNEKPEDEYPEIMTVAQAAGYLQLHKQVLYRHVRRGTVPVSRVGRTLRFKKSVLDAWLERTAWQSVGLEPPTPPPQKSAQTDLNLDED